MATTTYEPLATVTASGSSSTQLVMSSIPSTYTDLVLVISGTSTSTTNNMDITFNGDTTSGLYNRTYMSGYGTGTEGNSAVGQNSIRLTANGIVTTAPGTYIYFINNYANTVTGKTIVGRSNNADYGTDMVIGLWNSASAITSITLSLTGSNFSSNTKFTLYGIANADIGAPKARGGSITYDDTYWYHTFSASGTFTPQQSLTADVLVVAGGGGGSSYSGGGGGGAGGLLGFANQSLTATGYTVSVGAGGGAQTGGSDSQFGALTLVKGGGQSNNRGVAGSTGGSGGGGSANASGGAGAVSGGSGTSGQGNAGGSGNHISGQYESGGGGGGAGAAGENGASSTTGAGGIGLSTYSSWGLVTGTGENVSGTVYYAGGGAGYNSPTGGLGGGGKAFTYRGTSAANGLAMSGGGGASGQTSAYAGGNGGSGVVIIRYLKA
jgi:hypothetical protein